MDNIRVILVEPVDARNLGSVCRAIKTMGIRSLYITGTRKLDLEQAEISAVHAKDVLHGATMVETLEEALQNTVLAAGITRRKGKKRKYALLYPEELAGRIAAIAEGSVALVFGNENSGLSARDLSLCHLAVCIPSSPLFPSLNLSHAVQVITYQIYCYHGPKGYYTPIDDRELGNLTSGILQTLKTVGFFQQVSPDDLGAFWRDILSRASLSRREADRLEVVFKTISGLFQRGRQDR